MRRGEFDIVDHEISGLHFGLQVGRQLGNGLGDHLTIVAATDIRHPLGNRHDGADRRSAARPAQQLDIGLAELPKRCRDVALGIKIESHFLLVEHFLLDDRFEQPALVSEIDVQRSLGDAGGSGDLAHAGAVKSEIHEDLAGSVEDLTPLRAFLVRDRVERSGVGCNHWFSFS